MGHREGFPGIPPGPCPGGFTLLEVLLAVAITGAALGVLLSGIVQSHRMAFRGVVVQEAASVAAELLRRFQYEGYVQEEGVPCRGHEGWTYTLEIHDLSVKSREEGGGEERLIDSPGLREARLVVRPPRGGPPYVVTMWVPQGEVHE